MLTNLIPATTSNDFPIDYKEKDVVHSALIMRGITFLHFLIIQSRYLILFICIDLMVVSRVKGVDLMVDID